MTDVVLKLPIQPGEEAHQFGLYLSEFMQHRSSLAEQMAAEADAPFLMIRGDPVTGEEAKVLIFQENGMAQAFASGWTRRRAQSVAAE
jgi:hypothetical protein